MWIKVSGFKNPEYEVNEQGDVRKKGETINLRKNIINGESYYILRKDKLTIRCLQKELVANAFVVNPNNFTKIIHKNGDKQNCSFDNLEWVKDEENEEWVRISGFNNYEINKKGQIRNYKTKILKKCSATSTGYVVVILKQNGKNYSRAVHILVANQFIPNPQNKPIVNHIDENKSNNCVENLEWVTHKENCQHGTRNKKIGERRSKPINEYDVNGKYIRTWVSCAAFAKHYGIQRAAAYCCLRGSCYTIAGRQIKHYDGDTSNISPVPMEKRKSLYCKYDYKKKVPSEFIYKQLNPKEEISKYLYEIMNVQMTKENLKFRLEKIKNYIDELETKVEKYKLKNDSLI